MIKLKSLTTFLIVLAAAFTLSACAENAESTGEKIDEIASDVGHVINDACEGVKETVKAKNTDC